VTNVIDLPVIPDADFVVLALEQPANATTLASAIPMANADFDFEGQTDINLFSLCKGASGAATWRRERIKIRLHLELPENQE
jgi:hypothetical protein